MENLSESYYWFQFTNTKTQISRSAVMPDILFHIYMLDSSS